MNLQRTIYLPVLNKAIIIMLTAALAYPGKTQEMDGSANADSGNNSLAESAIDHK